MTRIARGIPATLRSSDPTDRIPRLKGNSSLIKRLSRYFQIARPSAICQAAPDPLQRRESIFLGDRVLAWTHRGERIYLVPQDIDLTPRILFSGDWENHVEQTMQRLLRSGATAIDLGANVGYHTIGLCNAVAPAGRVFAFEPHPQLTRLLTATIFVNHLEALAELHCSAVADRPGTLTLALTPDHYGSGNIVPATANQSYEEGYPIRFTVSAVTLDGSLGDRVRSVDLIHMDIEGLEPLALRGAQQLIERSPTVKIVTEWSVGLMSVHGVDIEAHVSWLEALGFRFWRIDNDTANLIPLDRGALFELQHSDLLLSRNDPG